MRIARNRQETNRNVERYWRNRPIHREEDNDKEIRGLEKDKTKMQEEDSEEKRENHVKGERVRKQQRNLRRA